MRARRSTGILVAIQANLAILALTLTGCSAPTLTPPSLSSDTPVVFTFYEHDGNGGLEALNASNGQPLWKTRVGNLYSDSNSSTVMAHGVVYGIADHNFSDKAAAQHLPPARSVIAVRASDGKLLWRLAEPNTNGTPYLAADSSMVVLSDEAGLRGLDPATGKQRWHIAASGYAFLMRHGIIYIGRSTSLVAVRTSDGAMLWRTPLDFSYFNALLVGNDHALYANTGGGSFWALDAHTGQRLTSDSPYAVGDQDKTGTTSGYLVAASDKVVLLIITKSGTQYMQSFSAVDGRLLWEVPFPFSSSAPYSQLKIGSGIRLVGDFIYIAGVFGKINALRVRDGSLAWQVGYAKLSPGIVSVTGGSIFVILYDFHANGDHCFLDCGVSVVALDATTGAVHWRRDVESASFPVVPAQ